MAQFLNFLNFQIGPIQGGTEGRGEIPGQMFGQFEADPPWKEFVERVAQFNGVGAVAAVERECRNDAKRKGDISETKSEGVGQRLTMLKLILLMFSTMV
jgi:hypothetical protein